MRHARSSRSRARRASRECERNAGDAMTQKFPRASRRVASRRVAHSRAMRRATPSDAMRHTHETSRRGNASRPYSAVVGVDRGSDTRTIILLSTPGAKEKVYGAVRIVCMESVGATYRRGETTRVFLCRGIHPRAFGGSLYDVEGRARVRLSYGR